MPGAPVFGMLAATYGPHRPTQLETWNPVTHRGWTLGEMGGLPKPHNFDTDPQTYEWLPSLGWSAFGVGRLRWYIPAVRLRPPAQDLHLFYRDMAQIADEKRKERETAKTTPPGPNTYPPTQQDISRSVEKLYTNAHPRERRDESIMAEARRSTFSLAPKVTIESVTRTGVRRHTYATPGRSRKIRAAPCFPNIHPRGYHIQPPPIFCIPKSFPYIVIGGNRPPPFIDGGGK